MPLARNQDLLRFLTLKLDLEREQKNETAARSRSEPVLVLEIGSEKTPGQGFHDATIDSSSSKSLTS